MPLLGLLDAPVYHVFLLRCVIVLFEALGPIVNNFHLIDSDSTGERSQVFDLGDLFFNDFFIGSLLHDNFIGDAITAIHLLLHEAGVSLRIGWRFTTGVVLFVEFARGLVKVRLRLVNTDSHRSHPLFVFLLFFVRDLNRLHPIHQSMQVLVDYQRRLRTQHHTVVFGSVCRLQVVLQRVEAFRETSGFSAALEARAAVHAHGEGRGGVAGREGLLENVEADVGVEAASDDDLLGDEEFGGCVF